MGAAQAIRTGLAKSFQFSGRASRSEFWWFLAFTFFLPLSIGAMLDRLIFGHNIFKDDGIAYLTEAFFLLTFPASAAVTARRLQDRSLPGIWAAVALVLLTAFSYLDDAHGLIDVQPYRTLLIILAVLNIAVLIIVLLPSTPHPNRYGPPPSEVTP
jgi:uncharacterized membrane protein YhaH (DUF805 family)